jgi:RAB protein geranylgeranyltransferase component A
MIIENEYIREREIIAFTNTLKEIMNNKNLSTLEKQQEIKCFLGIDIKYEDKILKELIQVMEVA